jgi:MFS family permease
MWRAVPAGVLETLGTTFGMLIAVRVFAMGDTAKSFFLASTSGGLMASLFVVPLLRRLRGTLGGTAAGVQFAGAGAVTVTALFPESPAAFMAGLSIGLFCMAMQIPLLTQLYRRFYPEISRGRLFSLTGIVRAAAAMVFGFLGGWLLDLALENYRWLLWCFAASALLSGVLTRGLPKAGWGGAEDSPGQAPAASLSLLSSLRWVRIDRDFRTLLISWMIMGVGNLVAASLFVEYLANPKHGIDLPEKWIAWIVGIIPVSFRLLFSYPWGLIYDRVHFFTVRAVLNVFFAAAALVFFAGDGLWAWITGMALFGVANAGGNVTWSLWVTKLAPPHAVAEYMSVHTFLTGLRGLVSPFLAFALIRHFSFQEIGIGCAVSILAASGFITIRARDGDDSGRLRGVERL